MNARVLFAWLSIVGALLDLTSMTYAFAARANLDMESSCSDATTTASVSSSRWNRRERQQRRRELIGHPDLKPDFKMHIKCAYCKEYGHHIDNCIAAFVARLNNVENHCAYDRHDPYRHGNDWRCNNCGKHINADEVERYYPHRFSARKA